jgi:hypothetical protein
MQKDIKEGMSPNYKEPYSYRQNATETFDDMDQPSSALETRKGFDLLKTYDRARRGWPTMKTASVQEKTMADKLRNMRIRKGLDPETGEYIPGQYMEDMGGNAANLSTGASIGNQTPENALAIRTMHSRGLGAAKRGAMGSEWDSAYASLSEVHTNLRELIQLIRLN